MLNYSSIMRTPLPVITTNIVSKRYSCYPNRQLTRFCSTAPLLLCLLIDSSVCLAWAPPSCRSEQHLHSNPSKLKAWASALPRTAAADHLPAQQTLDIRLVLYTSSNLQKRGELNHSGPKHTHKWFSWLQTWRVPRTTSLIFWRKWHPATRISGQSWCTYLDRVIKSMHAYLQGLWWR